MDILREAVRTQLIEGVHCVALRFFPLVRKRNTIASMMCVLERNFIVLLSLPVENQIGILCLVNNICPHLTSWGCLLTHFPEKDIVMSIILFITPAKGPGCTH